MYHHQPPTPQGFVPQSDGRRLIFPLSQFNGTFKTDHFIPSLVDYRCSVDEILLFFNDIYYNTKRMMAIRLSSRLMIWSLVLFVMTFILGITMEMENDYVDNYEDMDDTGMAVILGGVFVFIVVNIVAAVYRSQSKATLFRQVVNVLERHKYPFLQKGLRWAVPENCNYLELWMDYRYFSPYYMQPYVPSLTNSPYLPRSQTPSYVQKPVENNTVTQPEENLSLQRTASQNQASYPSFDTQQTNEQPQLQQPNFRPIPNSTSTGIQMQPIPSLGMYPPPAYPQAYQYNFYQPPYLQENLLQQQQDNDNQKLLRPYV